VSTAAELKEAAERIAKERAVRMACKCGAELQYIVTLESDDEGRFGIYLVQCPACKAIATRDRL